MINKCLMHKLSAPYEIHTSHGRARMGTDGHGCAEDHLLLAALEKQSFERSEIRNLIKSYELAKLAQRVPQ